MRMRFQARVSLLAALLLAAIGFAPAAAIEPAPTIPLEEIEAGLRGYGLSVFGGGEPERFDVEVLGVMSNVMPETSYILARLSGNGLEETGVIAGMSGSPVYLDGRLAGAVSFSWPFSREPIAGITPIEAMRRLATAPATSRPSSAGPAPALGELLIPERSHDLFERQLELLRPRLPDGTAAGIQWIAVGFGSRSLQLLGSALGGVAPGGRSSAKLDRDLGPGSAVAGILIDGDLRLAATGTVTDRTGDEILAFGHPFLGLGPVMVPMAKAEVVTVLSNQLSSFKIANYGEAVGAFDLDRQVGLRGRLGTEASTIPLRVAIRGLRNGDFELELADVPSITPVLLAISMIACLDSTSQAAGGQGIDMEARFHMADHGELAIDQSFDGERAAIDSAVYLLAVSGFLLQGRLAEVELERVEIEITQHPQPRTARLVGAHASQTLVRPGDRVALNLDLVAYRGAPFRREFEIELPTGLPAGQYSLLLGDGLTMDAARLQVERAEPVSFSQALGLLRSFHSRRELVVLGLLAGRGLTVAGEVLPQLPGSIRSVWGAAASGSAVPLALVVAQEHVEPLGVPLEGAVRIDLEVRRREPLAPTGPGSPGEGEEGGAEGGDMEQGGDEGSEAAAAPELSGDPAAEAGGGKGEQR